MAPPPPRGQEERRDHPLTGRAGLDSQRTPTASARSSPSSSCWSGPVAGAVCPVDACGSTDWCDHARRTGPRDYVPFSFILFDTFYLSLMHGHYIYIYVYILCVPTFYYQQGL
jgi:hypothetical protein